MALIKNLYRMLTNYEYLSKAKISTLSKTKIILTMVKMNLKHATINKVFRLKEEKILGYTITGFSYGKLRYLFEEIFYKNEYAFKSENGAPVIFDCGANIGLATIYFKWLYPQSRIYAFEPDPTTFRILEKNIMTNDLHDVKLFNCALSNHNEKSELFVDVNDPGSLTMSADKERMRKDSVVVDTMVLSDFIELNNISIINFVKMDIEGSEVKVIEELLASRRLALIEKMIVEYHHKINSKKSCLGSFLRLFESDQFDYQIDARCIPISSEDEYQDIMIYLYRRDMLK